MQFQTSTGPGEYTMIDIYGIRWRCSPGGNIVSEFEDNILAKMDADVLRAQEMARQQAGTEAYLKAILGKPSSKGTTGTFMYMDNNPVTVNHAYDGRCETCRTKPCSCTPAPLVMGGQGRDAGSLRATAAGILEGVAWVLVAMAFVGGIVAFVHLFY